MRLRRQSDKDGAKKNPWTPPRALLNLITKTHMPNQETKSMPSIYKIVMCCDFNSLIQYFSTFYPLEFEDSSL